MMKTQVRRLAQRVHFTLKKVNKLRVIQLDILKSDQMELQIIQIDYLTHLGNASY